MQFKDTIDIFPTIMRNLAINSVGKMQLLVVEARGTYPCN
jgi:hypothetical protein